MLPTQLKPRKSFCVKDLNAHNFFDTLEKLQAGENGNIENPRRPKRHRSKSALGMIPLAGPSNTEECTLEQGQALKYLRILGKKLRAHYFLLNTPISSSKPEACGELTWNQIELSLISQNNPSEFSATGMCRFEESDSKVFKSSY